MRSAISSVLLALSCTSPSKPEDAPKPAPPAKSEPAPATDPEAAREAVLEAAAEQSPIKSDENVILFPLAAAEDRAAGVWRVPIHGWIYEPETEDTVRNAMMSGLREILGDDPGFSTDVFTARLRPFLWDNERGKRIPIAAAGKVVMTDASLANGHFKGALEVPVADARRDALQYHGKDPPARLPVHALTRAGDGRTFQTVAYLLPPQGLSIVSDIDDTVRISEVADTKAMLRRAFFEPLTAVPGMAELYGGWMAEASGAHLHFLSSSPWQLYPELVQMLNTAGFPDASFELRTIRLHDTSLAQLLEQPTQAKTEAIEALLARFPERRFVLVGDSGEQDPEIYGAIARAHPEQVVYVAIRDVTNEGARHRRYAKAFEHVKTRWEVFTDPSALSGP